jgi:hypothetical protein
MQCGQIVQVERSMQRTQSSSECCIYRGLEHAGELVAVVLAMRPIVLVVVLEHAGPATRTYRTTVAADGIAVLACLRVVGLSRPRHERRLAYSVWDRLELGFEFHCRYWRAGWLISVGLLHLSVNISVAEVVPFMARVHNRSKACSYCWRLIDT